MGEVRTYMRLLSACTSVHSLTHAEQNPAERLVVSIPAMQDVLGERWFVNQWHKHMLVAEVQRQELANCVPGSHVFDVARPRYP